MKKVGIYLKTEGKKDAIRTSLIIFLITCEVNNNCQELNWRVNNSIRQGRMIDKVREGRKIRGLNSLKLGWTTLAWTVSLESLVTPVRRIRSQARKGSLDEGLRNVQKGSIKKKLVACTRNIPAKQFGVLITITIWIVGASPAQRKHPIRWGPSIYGKMIPNIASD